MKYVILVGDGMADRPVEALQGRTPLAAAFTPNMDSLVSTGGWCGAAYTLPENLPAGSDVANLSILGYDPERYYTGRAPLEAASMGIELKDTDVAFRCNLVTLGRREDGKRYMEDYSAGQISQDEGRQLIRHLNDHLRDKMRGVLCDGADFRFYPGVSYRNLLLWNALTPDMTASGCTPPHDITGKGIDEWLPRGEGAGALILNVMIESSWEMLEDHPINRKRVAEGKKPANSIWLWGQGKKPALPRFSGAYGIPGAMISAVDLTRGLAGLAGLDVINVPGATGYIDTNYAGKAQYALKSLEEGADLVYVHVEAPDEASHEGSLEHKIKAIEDFDALIVGAIMKGMREKGKEKNFERFRVLLMPDHATPLALRTHSREPVPFVIWDSGQDTPAMAGGYNESILGLEGIVHLPAHKIMGRLLEI